MVCLEHTNRIHPVQRLILFLIAEESSPPKNVRVISTKTDDKMGAMTVIWDPPCPLESDEKVSHTP